MTPSFDASEIDHWPDTAETAHKLPELIRRLVLATLTEPPSRIDMPRGSSVRMSGWDGLLHRFFLLDLFGIRKGYFVRKAFCP